MKRLMMKRLITTEDLKKYSKTVVKDKVVDSLEPLIKEFVAHFKTDKWNLRTDYVLSEMLHHAIGIDPFAYFVKRLSDYGVSVGVVEDEEGLMFDVKPAKTSRKKAKKKTKKKIKRKKK